MYPKNAPTEALDYGKLAQLNVSSNSIRNIALSSAFLTADDASPIQMRCILQAAHAEYAKQDKVIAQAEVRGWLEDECTPFQTRILICVQDGALEFGIARIRCAGRD